MLTGCPAVPGGESPAKVFREFWILFGMTGKKIEVISYSGYKGEETPRFLVINDRRIEVVQILRTRIEEGVEDRARREVFEVTGSDGHAYRVCYDETAGSWFLEEGPLDARPVL